MKKRLALIILTVILILVGKSDALTLTQKLGDEYMETKVEEGEIVTMNFNSKLGFQFKNWEVSGVTGVDTTKPEITFTIEDEDVVVEGKYVSSYTITFSNNGGTGYMSSCNVTAGASRSLPKNKFTKQLHTFEGWAETPDGEVVYQDEENIRPNGNMTLYAVWKMFEFMIPLDEVPVGSYVSYETPAGTATVYASDTGTSGDQSFNIKAYKDGWKLYKHDNGQVEIISAESIGNLELEGGTGYANAVYTLNTLCGQYVNSKYAVSGRSLGSTADWIEEPLGPWSSFDGTKSAGKLDTDSWAYPLTNTARSEYPYCDELWSSDVQYITHDTSTSNGNEMEYPLLQKKDFVWMAGRNGSSGMFRVRFLSPYDLADDMFAESIELYSYYSQGNDEISSSAMGVRPVIALKSGIHVVSGDGSKEKPYILYPGYAITFDSNGGNGSMETLKIIDGLNENLPENKFTKPYHTFVGWSKSPNGEVYYQDEENITPEENMTLYAVWMLSEVMPIDEVPVGAYVSYEPPVGTAIAYASDTGTSGDQSFNIKAYKDGWKLYKKDSGQVEIISAESIGYLTLAGGTGYANAVYTLNTLCSQYVNNEYAVSGRSLGSTADWIKEPVDPWSNFDNTKSAGKINTDYWAYPLTNAATYDYPYDDSFWYSDVGYITHDTSILNGNGKEYPLLQKKAFVWLAGRAYSGSFNIRFLSTYDLADDLFAEILPLYSDYYGDEEQTMGVRPVIVLNPSLKITSGNGTLAKPYVLSK